MFRGKWFRGLGQRFLRLSETKTRTRSIGTTFITQLTQGTKFVRFSGNANRGKSYTERNVDCISKLPNHTPPLGSSDSTSGSRHTFATARRYSPLEVLTVITLTMPSLPGCNETIRPIFHSCGDRFSSRSNTKDPILISRTPSFHFCRVCNVWR